MFRRLLPVAVFVTALSHPAFALAASDGFVVPSPLSMTVGIVGLLLAIGLMLDVLALRRVAEGAAIAENMSYVVGGVLCLAASVLASWVGRQLPSDLALEQVRLAADLLVIASMVFFGVYFFRVRQAMLRFLSALRGDELLAAAHGAERDEEAAGV